MIVGLSDWWRSVREHRGVQRAIALAQAGLFISVCVFLIYRLSRLGIGDVLASLPASPWFYLFFGLRFLLPPLSDSAAFEILWRRPMLLHLPVLVRKKVYNYAVAGYSGEAFLALWARRRLALPDRLVLGAIKDSSLTSAFTSNLATIAAIGGLALFGLLGMAIEAVPGGRALFAFAFGIAFLLALIAILARRKLTSLPAQSIGRLLAIHGVRQLVSPALQVSMYAAALPGASFDIWALFVATQLVVSRIPFLPNQELVYAGVALSLAPLVGAPETGVAGMLVAEAGLAQILNIALFFATAPLARRIGFR